MIKNIKLKNFRNFQDSEFFFDEKFNVIIGENWKWKTNILEAISIIHWKKLSKLDFENLVNKDKDIFFIETEDNKWSKIAISYDKKDKKKKYIFDKKATTKKKLLEEVSSTIHFSPMLMNIMYLSPSLRREFLDEILSWTFRDYKEILSEYKKILISRNKILKNIRENKSSKSETNFWNEKLAKKASIIYNYRFWIIDFIRENTKNFTKYFEEKISSFEFIYKTKIEIKKQDKKEKLEDIEKQIIYYLEENINKDILSWNTSIWPHIDDFEILVDDLELVKFASRWEVKSVIIWLKLLEIKFVEKYRNKKPILLLDDLISELDEKHKNMIIGSIDWYQTFISSIKNDFWKEFNVVNL